MDLFVEHQLKQAGRSADPDPRFVHALKARLQTEVGYPLRWVEGWKWAVGAVTSLSLISSGTGVYAYTSEEVLPEHPLYGLRQAIERVEEVTAFNPEAKALVQVRHLERRVKEHRIANVKRRKLSKGLMQKFEQGLNAVIDGNGKLPEAVRDRLDERAGDLRVQHEDVLNEAVDDKEFIRQELERINKKIESLEVRRKANFERSRRTRPAPERE